MPERRDRCRSNGLDEGRQRKEGLLTTQLPKRFHRNVDRASKLTLSTWIGVPIVSQLRRRCRDVTQSDRGLGVGGDLRHFPFATDQHFEPFVTTQLNTSSARAQVLDCERQSGTCASHCTWNGACGADINVVGDAQPSSGQASGGRLLEWAVHVESSGMLTAKRSQQHVHSSTRTSRCLSTAEPNPAREVTETFNHARARARVFSPVLAPSMADQEYHMTQP